MKKKQYISLVLIFLTLSGLLFCFLPFSELSLQKGYFQIQNEENKDMLESAAVGDPLPLNYIELNRSEVYRLFESINISIYAPNFLFPTIDRAVVEISFTNGSVRTYNMTGFGVEQYIYVYRPEYNAPLGVQNVSFLLYNASYDLLNAHTTFKSFTIKTNYMLTFDSSEYYVEDILFAELTVNDFKTYEFDWNITIVDSVNGATQVNLFDLEDNLVQFSFMIENDTFDQVDKIYYVKVNISDVGTGLVYPTYFPFNVLNSLPRIIPSSINFSLVEVPRTESCDISLNVTDIENISEELIVKMELEDPNGDKIYVNIEHDEGTLFSDSFSIPANRPKGNYRVNFTAEDLDNGVGSYSTFLTVINNPPEIHSYKINGYSMDESISVLYGDDLTFTFNVSDVEGIAYITVALIDKNNDWYNITNVYTGEDMRIVIRTAELVKGTWYVYIYVTDTDGETTSLIDDYDMAPQQIRIITDLFSGILPWVTFFVGLIFGILVGIGGSYKLAKSSLLEAQKATPKKKEPLKPIKKTEKKVKKPKKEEPVREVEKELPKEEEEKQTTPFRKIKRKLK
ncbi:MAG: hypothetical protein ACFE8L_01855 [Candidatus Hodarchaeota archaeon]